MTLTQLRAAIAYKTNMSLSNSTELARIDAWVNEAYEDILLRTQCQVEHGDVTTTADEWRYDLPTVAMDIIEVWLEDDGGNTVPFERTSSRHIIRLRAALETDISGPMRYWATEGSNLIMFWPTPTSVETINLLYVPRPTAMTTGSDSPSGVPAEFHKALEIYALWQAGDADDSASSKKGEYYRQLYEGPDGSGGWLDRIRTHMRRRGGRRLAPIDFSRGVAVGSRSADVGGWYW